MSSFSTLWPVLQAPLARKPAYIPTTITIPCVFQNKVDLIQDVDISTVRFHSEILTTDVYQDIKLFYNQWCAVLCIFWQKHSIMYFSTDLSGDTTAIIRNAVSHNASCIHTGVFCLFIHIRLHCSWIREHPGARAQQRRGEDSLFLTEEQVHVCY